MATPNSALRAARMGLLMSQDDFARALREAGQRTGEPDDASKRLVQRWEARRLHFPPPRLRTGSGGPHELAHRGAGLRAPAVPQAHVADDGRGGHDRGARYYGAIQTLAEPTGRRLAGEWVSFGKEVDVNTGPWELVFQDTSTNKATLDRYNHRPE